MDKITESLRKAAKEREERLRQRKEKKSMSSSQNLKEQAPLSPSVKEEKVSPTSLREALRRRTEKISLPSSPVTPSLPSTRAPSPSLPPGGLDPRLITYFEPYSPASEQYRLIRTNLQSLSSKNPPRTLVISSSIPGEGKTITAINLAIMMAQDINKPILLIDGTFRDPQICRYLDLTPKTGLTDFLMDSISLESMLLPTKINNLTVLPGGRVVLNPSLLLGSVRMKHLLTEVRSRFEYVIIDTAPILSATDAGIIGSETDGVLLVIQADRTKREVIQRAQSVLTEAKAKIIGYVLTQVQYPIPDLIYRHL